MDIKPIIEHYESFMMTMSFETIMRARKWPRKDLTTMKTRKNKSTATTISTTTTTGGNKTAEARELEI